MVGSTSSHEDDTENNEADNSDDLQTREPEFHLSENPCAEEVDSENEDQEHGHVDSGMSDRVCSSAQFDHRIDERTPVTDDDRSGHDLYRNCDCPTVCIY